MPPQLAQLLFKNSDIFTFRIMNKKLKILIFLTTLVFLAPFGIIQVFAATNIDSTYHWAWNDVVGWIDFYYTGNVNVNSSQLTGYASSSIGYIALDCATSPNGNICGTSDFKVSNDGSGNLSGWAWNDMVGWISFDSATASSSYVYQVSVAPATGDFSGWAWNDVVGWISFNCLNTNSCGTSNYKVKSGTGWTGIPLTANLVSSIFDTQLTNGAAINTVMWQGSKPYGTNVKFQIASSNASSGPWLYLGPDGSDTTYYTPNDANIPVQINLTQHNNKRHFRYKVFLESNVTQTASPRIDDIIINWSP